MQFGVREVFTFVMSVLQGAALRSTATVFETFVQTWDLPTAAPHWTSGRLWLLRVGLFKLTRPKPQGDDWIWFADHTVQIGVEKCLVVLGIRQSDLPPEGTCLTLEHLEPLLIEPMPRSNTRPHGCSSRCWKQMTRGANSAPRPVKPSSRHSKPNSRFWFHPANAPKPAT